MQLVQREVARCLLRGSQAAKSRHARGRRAIEPDGDDQAALVYLGPAKDAHGFIAFDAIDPHALIAVRANLWREGGIPIAIVLSSNFNLPNQSSNALARANLEL